MKAGLLDRAEDALARLENTPYENEARLSRLAIYERAHDWPQAVQIASLMHSHNQGDYSVRIAHYLCEQALGQLAHGQLDAAQDLLQQAQSEAPHAPRPRIELAHLQHKSGHPALALGSLMELAAVSPSSVPLVAPLMLELVKADERKPQVRALLEANYHSAPSLDVMQSLVHLDEFAGVEQAEGPVGRDWYIEHLRHEPSLVAAGRWLAQESLSHEEHHPAIQRALDNAAKPLTRYRCAACGFEARQHFWQCPGCQSWDSYPPRRVEEQ